MIDHRRVTPREKGQRRSTPRQPAFFPNTAPTFPHRFPHRSPRRETHQLLCCWNVPAAPTATPRHIGHQLPPQVDGRVPRPGATPPTRRWLSPIGFWALLCLPRPTLDHIGPRRCTVLRHNEAAPQEDFFLQGLWARTHRPPQLSQRRLNNSSRSLRPPGRHWDAVCFCAHQLRAINDGLCRSPGPRGHKTGTVYPSAHCGTFGRDE